MKRCAHSTVISDGLRGRRAVGAGRVGGLRLRGEGVKRRELSESRQNHVGQRQLCWEAPPLLGRPALSATSLLGAFALEPDPFQHVNPVLLSRERLIRSIIAPTKRTHSPLNLLLLRRGWRRVVGIRSRRQRLADLDQLPRPAHRPQWLNTVR